MRPGAATLGPHQGAELAEGMWVLQYDLRYSIGSDHQRLLLVGLFTRAGEGTMNWAPGNRFQAVMLTDCVTALFSILPPVLRLESRGFY